ncbi:MAG: hypothetical protein JRN19_05665 [Nitrososphaerota archaeon]|nr:hypothetical protein [Nitrososphaerota archaeon]
MSTIETRNKPPLADELASGIAVREAHTPLRERMSRRAPQHSYLSGRSCKDACPIRVVINVPVWICSEVVGNTTGNANFL